MAQVKTATTTTRTTTVVTEVPDERRWQGRDWVKAAIAGGLALALLRPGAQPVAQPTATVAPTAAAVATAVPAAAVAPTAAAAATAAPAVAVQPTVAAATAVPAAQAPRVLSTREVIFAGPYVLRGTGTPGSTVEVLVNGSSAGTATVDANGRWELPTTLEAGTAEVLARAVDGSGGVLAAGDAVRLGVEPAAASAPLIIGTADVPTAGPRTIGGSATPGSIVELIVNGTSLGTTEADAEGRWSFEAQLREGENEVVARTVDAAGTVLAAADPLILNALPAALGGTSESTTGGTSGATAITLGVPAEGATLPVGNTTISGTGVAGTVLEILNGDQVLGEATVGADGTWTAQVPLEAGTAALGVREKGSDQLAGRPVRVQVGSAAAVAPACTTLAVGCQAWVTRAGNLVLRMRSEGRITPDNIVARLPIGTQMEVLEGPLAADGFTWWRVRTTGGREGWVAGENLVLQPD